MIAKYDPPFLFVYLRKIMRDSKWMAVMVSDMWTSKKPITAVHPRCSQKQKKAEGLPVEVSLWFPFKPLSTDIPSFCGSIVLSRTLAANLRLFSPRSGNRIPAIRWIMAPLKDRIESINLRHVGKRRAIKQTRCAR
jgi:hypothetical protein